MSCAQCPRILWLTKIWVFVADGAGEHSFVRVEKRGANTDWVAGELARFAGVDERAVSYAGLKDRHAVARQTFSLHLPGKPDPDWAALQHAEFRILDVARHGRKLQRGALKGNHFRIVLRDVKGDRIAAERIFASIAAGGVPNYFGEQRFGRGGDNVRRALAMFQGKRIARNERSLLLSAARSHVFNRVLSARVQRGDWNQPINGEVWMLAGTHSIFGPEAITPQLRDRFVRGDIDITGALWGEGELRSTAQVRQLESEIAQANPQLVCRPRSQRLAPTAPRAGFAPAEFCGPMVDARQYGAELLLELWILCHGSYSRNTSVLTAHAPWWHLACRPNAFASPAQGRAEVPSVLLHSI